MDGDVDSVSVFSGARGMVLITDRLVESLPGFIERIASQPLRWRRVDLNP